MKYLIINCDEAVDGDILANCLGTYEEFNYVEPFTTNREYSRIWNTPYVSIHKMNQLLGKSAPVVAIYVDNDVYAYFNGMMKEDKWNILILDKDGLKQLKNNCGNDTIETIHINTPNQNNDLEGDFDVIIHYDQFIMDTAHMIKEYVENEY